MTPCLHLLGPGSVCRHHCESHLLDIPTPPPLRRRGAPHQASGYPPHRRNGQLTMTRRVRVGVNVRHSKYNLITYTRDCSSFDPVSRLAPPGKKNLREKLGDAAWDNRGTGFISVTVCRVSGLPPTLWSLSLGSWSDIQFKAPAILRYWRNIHWRDGPPAFPSAGSQHASTS